MHPFHPRRVHEDLVPGPWLRELGDSGGIELEGQAGLHFPVLAALIEVGAQRGAHEAEEAAQDAVLVEVCHRVEGAPDLLDQDLPERLPIPGDRGVEADVEEPHERLRDPGIAGESRLHVLLAEGRSCLAQVLAVGTQHRDLAPSQPGAQHQAIEAVVLRIARPDAFEGFLELLSHPVDIDFQRLAGPHPEIVHPHP